MLDATLAQNQLKPKRCGTSRAFPMRRSPGLSVKHDVSLPIHLVPRFVEQASQLVAEEVPGYSASSHFGHVGDGMFTSSLSQPIDMERAAFARHKERLSALVHDLTMSMSGSFSAEARNRSAQARRASVAIDPPSNWMSCKIKTSARSSWPDESRQVL